MAEVYNQNQKNQKRFSKKTMAVILTVCAALVLVAGGFLGYQFFIKKAAPVNSDVVAEVAGQEIHLPEYKTWLFAATNEGTPENPAYLNDNIKGSILDDVIDSKIIDKELAKRNIQITDSEITVAAKSKYKNYDNVGREAQSAYRNFVKLQIGKTKLQSKIQSWREGYALYCYFNRSDMSDMSGKPDAAAKRASQEAYAKDYCTKVEQRLEAGTADYSNELAKLKADPVIGEAAWRPYTMDFGQELKKDASLGLVPPAPNGTPPSADNSTQYVTTVFQSSPQLVALSPEKNKYYLVRVEGQGKDNVKQGVMYAVVYIKDGYKGETNDFTSWLQNEEKLYQVKTYVDRIKL